MRVSLNWLNDYLDLSGLAATAVADTLTAIGHEVEGVEQTAKISGELVVGQIVTAQKHPNADTLQVCSVDVGEAEPLAIVCGAPNARAGLKVVVAKIGATLPGDFKIKKSKIRGETSCGMLCSEKELELSQSHDGIIELPPTAVIGADAVRLLALGDVVLEVNVTPNRPDCLGMIGVARDLAAKLKRPLKMPQLERTANTALKTRDLVTVTIDDQQGCVRFVALAMDGVKVVPSPAWLAQRLTACGMRPINLIVDATNFAMLEFSQPVHAYDQRQIRGGQLRVRSAAAGETLVTLDGQTRTLAAGDLVIADGQGILGLAGIMGGETSEVRPDTTAITIEVAAFTPPRVRKTARALNLHTEASHRFERGVDVDNLVQVAERVADLITKGLKAAGAPAPRTAADVVDCYPEGVAKRVVALRVSHAKQFLGLPALSRDEAAEILQGLEFEMLDSTDDRLLFEVPFFRTDVEREADLVEEIGRLIGYDKIPYQLPVMSIRPTPEDEFIDFLESARTAAAAAGLRETVTTPFGAEQEYKALGIEPEHPLYPRLSLANPMNDQQRLMATTLVPGLLRAVSENRRHGDKGARLFEVGRGYLAPQKADGERLKPPFAALLRSPQHFYRRAKGEATRPVERHWLAGVLDQPYTAKGWHGAETNADFFHGKAAVTAVARAFGIDGQLTFSRAEGYPFLHPGASALVSLGRKTLGFVGELHPRAARALDVTNGGVPVVFELDLEALFEAAQQFAPKTTLMQRFPPVTRDLALLVDQDKTHGDIDAAIGKFKKRQHLARVNLFDVFEGASLPAGKKSLAYSFAFQSPERTLSDQDVEQEIANLMAWLTESVGATLR